MKRYLNVGCGSSRQENLPIEGFKEQEWNEIRLDIDEVYNPDVLGSLTDMSLVETESVDGLFSSHNLEHLHSFDVPLALSEFYRVLNNDGFAVITCPDLQSISKRIAEGNLLEVLYVNPYGDVTPLDIIYGQRTQNYRKSEFMFHKCGFTSQVLYEFVVAAGFSVLFCASRDPGWDIWLIAFKNQDTINKLTDEQKENILKKYLPN